MKENCTAENMEIEAKQYKEIPGETVKHSYHESDDHPCISESFAAALRVDLSIPWKKPEFYSDGNGIKLKYIQTVATNIEVASDTFIEIMHYLLYLHIDGKSKMRRNILEFNGLKCDPGSLNYDCRVRILSALSMKQLTLICRVLCLPVWHYSRPFLSDGIMEFLAVPRVSAMKISAQPISSDEYTLSAGDATINQILLPELKSFGSEETEILPDIPVTAEVPSLCKDVNSADNTKMKSDETEQLEIVPDILISEQKQGRQSQYIPDHGSNQVFPKVVTLPNDMSADDYSEQVDMAYMKYVKSYLGFRLQPRKKPPRTRYQETEEQAAARRALNALRMRQYRQNLRERETEEEAAARRARNALRVRNYRKFKRELEPEMAAQRRAINAMRMRNYRKAKQDLNPEAAAERRAKNAMRMRNYRQNKRQTTQYRLVDCQASDSNYSANEELS